MNYTNFIEAVQERAQETAGEGGKVTVNHIIKNNGRELDGLVIMEKDSHISPTIYLNSYYDDYISGRKLDDIYDEIKKVYDSNKCRISVNPDSFSDYAKISHTIVYKIINYEKNIKLLENVPHKKLLDLAVVYYCMIEQKEEGNATALIYNNHLKMWNVSEDELHKAAIDNTPILLKSVVRPMSSIIDEMFDDMLEQDEYNEECMPSDMYVLTNECRINGAACMLYENVLKDLADRLSSDLYILPSSIHEVIILPKMAAFAKSELACMVREVNCEGVSYDEVLSDNVYEYNREDGMITI